MKDGEDASLAAAQLLLASDEKPAEGEGVVVEGQGAADAADLQEATEENDIFTTWEVELPDDLAAELDAPEVTQLDIQNELETHEDWEDMDEGQRALLARAVAAERKAQHFEALRLQDSRKLWKAEAEKFFPLSAHVLDSLDATSRTGYLKQAKEAHAAVIPYVKDITDKAKAQIEEEKTKATAEARAEAEKNWGKPPSGDQQPPAALVNQEKISENRRTGDFSTYVREMIFPKKGE